MKSLLLKDICIIGKRGVLIPLLALFFAVFAAMQANFLYFAMTTMMLMMLCLSTMAYDQNDGFDAYILALPIHKQAVVLEKYVLGLLALMVSLLIVLICTLVVGRQKADIPSYLLMQSAIGFIFMAINYPLIFRFGFEKSRVWYILISMALATSTGIAVNLGLYYTIHTAITIMLPFSALALVIISYLVSLHIIKNKELFEN